MSREGDLEMLVEPQSRLTSNKTEGAELKNDEDSDSDETVALE